MNQLRSTVPVPYDPNRLLDSLLQQLQLPGDDALSRILNVAPVLLYRIRRRQVAVGPSLLIRMSEVSDRSVRELRQWMGDRRAEYRLSDAQGKRRLRETDEAGLPNSVQWT